MISAQTGLGLRPPKPGALPGCSGAPTALRSAGLFRRFEDEGAADLGTVAPGRYSAEVKTGHIRNETQIIKFSKSLAEKISLAVNAGDSPLVIGGDCSVLMGAGLALKKRGRYGLVHIDGHTDFRHPGNSSRIASLAGEDLAAAIGLHWKSISDIDGAGPYFDPQNVIHLGCRANDEYLPEVRNAIHSAASSNDTKRCGARSVAEEAVSAMKSLGVDGFWLHLDVDVLDPRYMPAVDSPDPGGIGPRQLAKLLATLAPWAAGADVTVFDPDLDPSGVYAKLLTGVVFSGLRHLSQKALDTLHP